MPYNSNSDNNMSPWQAQEGFSLVDFLAEAPDYFAREPFTIHVHPRSEGIHEFLNLQIQLKVARLIRIKDQIQHQIKAYQKQEAIPQTEEKPKALSTTETGNLVYQKDGKVFQIAVSPEQLDSYFDTKISHKPPEKPQPEKGRSKKRDIFDRFLHEPGFFKRSHNPEAVPPDASIEASITEDEDLVTETLARIHTSQGNHSEAQRIYHKLGLLFPEKSGYFEAQIEKLQDLDTKNDA